MRIDELRSTLDDHGAAVDDVGTAHRVEAVHGRIRAARRRRVAAAAGGTVVAVAGIALAVVPGMGAAPDLAPAEHPSPAVADYEKDGVVFRDVVLGERLLGAAIGDPGQAELSFDVRVGETGLRFTPLCYGVGRGYAVGLEVEGHRLSGAWCQRDRDPDPGASSTTFDVDPLEQRRKWNAEPGDVITVDVVIERSQGADGPVPATAVIGAGVYESTRPGRIVAGVRVPDQIEHDGRVWTLALVYEGDPGSDSIRIETDADSDNGPHVVVAATSGFRGEASYSIELDGEVIDGMSQSPGTTGPSWQTVREFEDGSPYELELVVEKGLTDRTRLALLSYLPAG